MAIALLLLGCVTDPVTTSGTDNREIDVDKLFTHDDCAVYRFKDAGRYHYFVKCAAPVLPGAAIGSQDTTTYNPATKTTTTTHQEENVETR